MKQRLSDALIRNAKADRTIYHWDSEINGFGFRVTKSGVRTFVLLTGKGRRHTIGRYPVISLSDARNEAKRLLAQKTLGNAVQRRTRANTAVSDFLADCKKRLREKTVINYELSLRKLMLSGDLSRITTNQIARQLNTLTPSNKEHATRVGKTFFTWCRRQGLIDQSPMELMQAPLGKSRERVLSDQELGEIYKTALEGTDSFSRLIQFLCLTAQRRGETSLLTYDMIDTEKKLITFDSSIVKNKRTHTIPYVWRNCQPSTTSCNRVLVFPGLHGGTISGWSKLKRKFDAKHSVRDYTLHDIRRSIATKLIENNYCDIPTLQKLLNHVSGAGVTGIYMRHNFLPEMRQTLTLWGKHLNILITKP